MLYYGWGSLFLVAHLILGLLFISIGSSCGFMIDFCFFSLAGHEFSLSFLFDYISLGFFSVVCLISGVVFFYSRFYMTGSVDMSRFVLLVVAFVFSMGVLVFSGNFFLMMVGWDGLGLVSFCLVIYYNSNSSLISGLITVYSNRIGDVAFILMFFYLFDVGVWFSDSFVFFLPAVGFFLIFVGAITKSAQVPFSAWLPAAMAAPTPVSSLVHSSTLVTAGVYVLIRFNVMFVSFFWVTLSFSLFTMFVAGLCACFEMDFKKVIAMSTLSQLGLMVFSLSFGFWKLSVLHIILHALFKAMIFLGSGSMIVQFAGTQDSRFYGSLYFSRFSQLYLLIGGASLAGFPFLVGFYSKDAILLSLEGLSGFLVSHLFFFCCILTTVYTLRMIFGGFIKHWGATCVSGYREDPSFFFPVSLLFLMTVFSGSFFSWSFWKMEGLMYRWFDYSLGVSIGLVGFVVMMTLVSIYELVFLFSMMFFLRWLSSGGLGGTLPFMKVFKGEAGWMELVGGSGIFSTFFRSSYRFWGFYSLGIKGMMAALLGMSVLMLF